MASQSFDRSHRSTTTLAERRLRSAAGSRLDLAGTVNRYGPPEAVLRALRTLSPRDVQAQPAAAAARLAERYAEVLGVDPDELVAGRGTVRLPPGHRRPRPPRLGGRAPAGAGRGPVDLPRPGLHLLLRPSRSPPSSRSTRPSTRPTWWSCPTPTPSPASSSTPCALAEIANRHPASTLVVDETDIEFLPDPARSSLVGTDADNVIVLRSASEFSGMGSTRTGVAWSRDRYLLRVLFDPRFASPVSGLDVVATEAALASRVWADAVRRQLAEDGGWLAARPGPPRTRGRRQRRHALPLPRHRPGRRSWPPGSPATASTSSWWARPRASTPAALRIAAPRVSERAAFTAAVHALTAVPAMASPRAGRRRLTDLRGGSVIPPWPSRLGHRRILSAGRTCLAAPVSPPIATPARPRGACVVAAFGGVACGDDDDDGRHGPATSRGQRSPPTARRRSTLETYFAEDPDVDFETASPEESRRRRSAPTSRAPSRSSTTSCRSSRPRSRIPSTSRSGRSTRPWAGADLDAVFETPEVKAAEDDVHALRPGELRVGHGSR